MFFEFLEESFGLRADGFVFGFCEFSKQFFLFCVKFGWCFNCDLDELVASSSGSQIRQALAFDSEDTSVLGTGRYFQLSRAV